MTYTVTNTHQNIVITLDTESNQTSNLYLKAYINGGSTAFKTYTLNSSNQFIVYLNEYTLGDTIRFEMVQSGSPKLWETNEGVKILLNGEVLNNVDITTNNGYGQFTLDFEKDGEYDIQAYYMGNGSNTISKTQKKHFLVSQPPLNEEGSLDNDGKYALNFVNATLPSLKYNDGQKIFFRLTKGGVPAPNRVVQRVMGSNGIGTSQTDNKGMVFIENTNLNAGKWKVGAYYLDETTDKVITSKYRTVNIAKATTTLKDNYYTNDSQTEDTNFIKGSKYVVWLRHKGGVLTNRKVDMYVNTKKTTKTTSSYGAITFPFQSKGTYNIKVVFKGEQNYAKSELSRTITISE